MNDIDPFFAAIKAALPKGERIVVRLPAFDVDRKTEITSNGRVRTTLVGLTPYTLVLTSLAVRSFRFGVRHRREGWRRQSYQVPTIVFTQDFPLSGISSTSLTSVRLDRQLAKMIAREYGMEDRPKVGYDLRLFSNRGESITTSLGGLPDFHRCLNDLRAGRMIATETSRAGAALSQLAKLREDGLINDAEFEAAKLGFLGAQPNEAAMALSSIRQLHEMRCSGALTEGVYRMAVGSALVKLEGS